MMEQMKKSIREYMSEQEAFWFSARNCLMLVERLADEQNLRLPYGMADKLVTWMMDEM